MPNVSLFGYGPHDATTPRSLDELVAEFIAPHAKSSNQRHGIAVRHLLHWLKLRKIALSDVDDAVLDRFGRHRCSCSRYWSTPRRDPHHMTTVRMFVHLLAQRGVIAPHQHRVTSQLEAYRAELMSKDYAAKVVARMMFDARHFAYWAGCNADWGRIDRTIIERYAQHDCSCPTAMSGHRSSNGVGVRRRHAAKFGAFLVRQGAIVPLPGAPELDERLTAYTQWLSTIRGLSPVSVTQSLREVKRWYGVICGERATCSAQALRSILLAQDATRSKTALDRTATTLRSFVRFLIARGECPPDLMAVLTATPRRSATKIPRYIDRASIEQILAACDTSTPIGLRNRAILLLLARLGLRAGDLVSMQLADIDWDQGTIRVSGKSARATRLPLPQDAGEAILAYIEQARPAVASAHLFLCLKAPYQPFRGSSIICWIVAQAVERAGLTGIPTGSHVFRHSLATSMLREGSTLEAIGTVLRHTKPDTTAIYAKVDLNMLAQAAQPWIGGVPC